MNFANQQMGKFVREKLPDPLTFYQSRGLVLQPGKEWRRTSCEFHMSRRTMFVNMKSGAFVCYGQCGAKGGSVLDYHMAINGISFYKAAKELGAIELNGQPYTGPKRPTRIPAHDLLQLAKKDLYMCATVISAVAQAIKTHPELESSIQPKINANDLQSFFKAAGQIVYVSEISNA